MGFRNYKLSLYKWIAFVRKLMTTYFSWNGKSTDCICVQSHGLSPDRSEIEKFGMPMSQANHWRIAEGLNAHLQPAWISPMYITLWSSDTIIDWMPSYRRSEKFGFRIIWRKASTFWRTGHVLLRWWRMLVQGKDGGLHDRNQISPVRQIYGSDWRGDLSSLN